MARITAGSQLLASMIALLMLQPDYMDGNIVRAIGERTYLERVNDGTEKECPSAVLRVEKAQTSFPPDVQLPTAEIKHR
jgi:hypothetical protein